MSGSTQEAAQEGRGRGWSQEHPAEAALVYVLSYLLAAVVGGWAVARIATPALAGIAVTAAAAVVLALSLLLVLSICRIPMRARAELVAIVTASVVFALVRPNVFAILGRWLGHAAAGRQVAHALPALPGQLLLGNAVLIVWAALLGRLVARVIREGKLLLPVALVASLADIFTVFWGVVAHVTKTAPEVVQTFSAAAPVQPPPQVSAPILSAVGIGDFLFLALFLSVALTHSMRPAKTLWATFVLMLAAPLVFVFWPSAPGMPGLPFISASAIWANWRFLEFTREEKRALAFAGALVAAVAAALWVVFHR